MGRAFEILRSDKVGREEKKAQKIQASKRGGGREEEEG